MTQRYLGVNYASAREAVTGMALGAYRFLGGELKQTADETLFIELALRGYDLSRLRDNDEIIAETVKIG